MQYTPVIPPLPDPAGGSSPKPEPPVVPSFSPQNQPSTPAWARHPAAQGNMAAFPTTPYAGTTPFLAVPGMGAPGSYYIPPVALPHGPGTPMAPVGPSGFSADWTGFPNVAQPPPGTPWAPPAAPPAAPPGFGPAPPVPQAGYNPYMFGFQAMPWGAPPQFATPFVQAGPIPGAIPAGMAPPGWGAPTTPFAAPAGMMPAFAIPAMAAAGATPAPPQPPPPAASQRPQARIADGTDKFEKFSESRDYGPVIDTFLLKVVNADLELNPLLAPQPDRTEDRPYLKWNMLFSSGQCVKSTDPPPRSWSNGRHAPATWPRLSSLRLVSRAFPWEIPIKPSDPEAGVTCGDVIEGIADFMYGRVTGAQLDAATPSHKRVVSASFYHNRSTSPNVPGGKLPGTLLRCDWLGEQTTFGGIVRNDGLVKEICGAEMPGTFVLLCVQTWPMSAEEYKDAREREEEERRARRRSRATSRASTRPPSRMPSRQPSVHSATSSSDD